MTWFPRIYGPPVTQLSGPTCICVCCLLGAAHAIPLKGREAAAGCSDPFWPPALHGGQGSLPSQPPHPLVPFSSSSLLT